jgi:serine/threonine protein phosphatase PrpC
MQEETASKKDNIFAFTKKGYGKKKTECQDTHIILEKIGGANMTYLAVYDGHGANGRLVIH